jgi:hypothetical protein
MAALRSLVKLARMIGRGDWTLDVASPRIVPYRGSQPQVCENQR